VGAVAIGGAVRDDDPHAPSPEPPGVLPGPEADATPFWEREATVRRFADMPADERTLRELAGLRGARVLDVGCAGGRNAVALADAGLDVYALDASAAMVDETRRRLAAHVPDPEARVHHGPFEDLARYPAAHFDAVLAIGVLHIQPSIQAWRATAARVARLLRPGGRLLLSHFTPNPAPGHDPPAPVPGAPHLYDDVMRHRRTLLLTPDEADAELAAVGLVPRTHTVEGPMTSVTGHAITRLDGDYVRRDAPAPPPQEVSR
jgi:SAM-dependent methyltransferase